MHFFGHIIKIVSPSLNIDPYFLWICVKLSMHCIQNHANIEDAKEKGYVNKIIDDDIKKPDGISLMALSNARFD